MTERYDERQRLQQLATQSRADLIIFGLSVAERMLPNYRRFHAETAWGDEAVLRRALDLGWHEVLEGGGHSAEARALQEACAEQAPDTDDFHSLSVSAALDAANAAANVMSLLIERNVQMAVDIASYGVDTIDLLVQEWENMDPNSADLEERIRLHPLMQRELRRQREALELIASGVSPREAERLWRAPQFGNVDGLDDDGKHA